MNIASAYEVKLTYSLPLSESPPVRSDKLLLLTKGGVLVQGPWEGEYGERYTAWALLPKKSKLVESFLTANMGALQDVARVVEVPATVPAIQLELLDGTVELWTGLGGLWKRA